MCGIIGIFEKKIQTKEQQEQTRQLALSMGSKIRHRGPDWSGIYQDEQTTLVHERLSIVDVDSGAQPLYDTKTGRVMIVNGEIYDHKKLRGLLQKEHDWQTKSDCEVLLYLYDEFGPQFLDLVDGIFAFAIYDPKTKEYFIARDHMGITPLYIGHDHQGTTYIASEMKAIEQQCSEFKEFPPGQYYQSQHREFTRWYKPEWAETMPTKPVSHQDLKTALESSVKKQLMCDVPYGVLISGGLDSSLIAAIASKFAKQRVESEDQQHPEKAWWPQLHSFCIGLEGSPDLKYAREVAKYIGSIHHELKFTVQQGIDALREVIYHLETYDVTTIRASTPMYLMARKIKSLGIKMVLSGEGADEIFGGYLYFHKAPNKEELHQETVRKLMKLSKYDCLRANKSMAAWGVEVRVPFLGKDFMDYAMSFDPAEKMCSGDKPEKYVLRKSFEGYIPESVLWRQKEQFSDGVGYSWIDSLKALAEEKVTDKMMEEASKRFSLQPPTTKEAYLYREIFDDLFPSKSAALTVEVGPSIACSSPTAYRWSKEFEKMADPSGRAIGIHEKAVDSI